MEAAFARDLAKRIQALEAKMDKVFNSFAYVSVSFTDEAAPLRIRASAEKRFGGPLPSFVFQGQFDCFLEGVIAAEAAFDEHLAANDLTIRRKMALAIIDLVDAEGACTDRALRLAGFTQAQIDAQHEAASELAQEMASKGPFTVVLTGAGNHEEAA